MAEIRIYHNPKCSKSRGALEILRSRNVEPEIVEYLKDPPDRSTLERLVSILDVPATELVRRDARFEELGLRPEDVSDPSRVIEILLAHPELLQRPIVVRGDRAILARPSEKVNEIL